MTERIQPDESPGTRPTGGAAGTATLVMGLVFLLVAGLALVYGLGHRLPPDAFRFGLPVLLIALGLLGLTVNRSPRPRRRHRRTRATHRG